MNDRQALERLVKQVWEAHDDLEELLADVERHGRGRLELGHRVREAVGQLWRAHDLIERATLKLHGCFSPRELTRLMRG